MSFIVKVKEELLGYKSENKMELLVIIKMLGSLGLVNYGFNFFIIIENVKIVCYIYSMLEEYYYL